MKKTRLYNLVFSAVALILLTAGASYAWITQRASMATLLSIMPPDTITIIPVDKNDPKLALEELELEYREGDSDIDGHITIRRPVLVKSTNPSHKLEIVHTTNLNNLQFQIYLAEIPEGKKAVQIRQNEKGEDLSLAGEYINQQKGTRLALPQMLDNYKTTNVEAHAYPLYWLPYSICNCDEDSIQEGVTHVFSYPNKEFDSVSGTDKIFYYTYYYLEISWYEETKQTDLFYIMAYNVPE